MTDEKRSDRPEAADPSPTTPHVPPVPAAGSPAAAPAPARQPLPKRVLAAVAAAVVVAFGGGYAVSAVQGDSTATAAGMPGRPGAGSDGSDGQLGDQGDGRTDDEMNGRTGGPVAGEEHVIGTITSVGSDTVTVAVSDGSTATYSVTSATQILDDGRIAALSDLAKGTDVLVHVIPADSGDGTAERILAGSSAQDLGPPPSQTT